MTRFSLTLPTPVSTVALTALSAAATAKSLLELTKPRLALFSVLTAMAAYGAAASETTLADSLLALIGISLSAGGALSWNHWRERDTDACMHRTRSRPLPAGRVGSRLALAWSAMLSVGGIGLLLWQFNLLAAVLAAAIIGIYGFVYTPLKRRTRWATEVGSVSGAMPPLLGAAMASHLATPTAWTLFALLLFWQMPHFYAIGWLHRKDYQRVGFPLLPAVDPNGKRTASWSLGYSFALVLASIAPWAMGWLGALYACIATVCGMAFLRVAWRFYSDAPRREAHARSLFLASILYLPLILIALALDSWL